MSYYCPKLFDIFDIHRSNSDGIVEDNVCLCYVYGVQRLVHSCASESLFFHWQNIHSILSLGPDSIVL